MAASSSSRKPPGAMSRDERRRSQSPRTPAASGDPIGWLSARASSRARLRPGVCVGEDSGGCSRRWGRRHGRRWVLGAASSRAAVPGTRLLLTQEPAARSSGRLWPAASRGGVGRRRPGATRPLPVVGDASPAWLVAGEITASLGYGPGSGVLSPVGPEGAWPLPCGMREKLGVQVSLAMAPFLPLQARAEREVSQQRGESLLPSPAWLSPSCLKVLSSST